MGAVQLCLFAMDTHRLLKNLSRKSLLETLKISPFKSIYILVTVLPRFNSGFFNRDYYRVSFILIFDVTLIIIASFCISYHTTTDITMSLTERPIRHFLTAY